MAAIFSWPQYVNWALGNNFQYYFYQDRLVSIHENTLENVASSPGAKMGTWKCLRVQGFMIDPESIGVLKEIKLGCHDGNLGELFLFA